MNTWKGNYTSKVLNENYLVSVSHPKENLTLLEKVMKILFSPLTIILFAVVICVTLVLFSSYEEQSNCEKYEYKIVHQTAWTQFIWVGKIMGTVYHPARDSYQNVCVKLKITNMR